MAPIFDIPEREESPYAGYGLDSNPFAVDETLATIGGDDDITKFRRIICASAVARLAKSLATGLVDGNPQPAWMLEDKSTSNQFNIVVSTGVFRYLVAGQNPRILPVYVPLPQVANDFTGNVFKLIVDRLLPRYFRNVIYAFICRELEKTVADGQTALTIDAAELLKEIEATAGGALDEIFFGHEFALTTAEEYGVLIETNPEPEIEVTPEEDDGPEFVDYDAEDEIEVIEEIEVTEEIPEEEPVDERRALLLAFVAGRLADESSAAGETLRNAVDVSLTDGFVRGRLVLEKAPKAVDEIMGLIKLISFYYNGVVIMLDQIDPWKFLTEQERINILKDLYNVELISKGKAAVVVVSDERNFDDFDSGFKSRCRMLPLNLAWTLETSVNFSKDETKAEALLEDFLKSARPDGKSGLEPFDTSGVTAILKKSAGNILDGLEMCRRLIDAGSDAGFPAIDKSFVEMTL